MPRKTYPLDLGGHTVNVSNPEKVMFPAVGFTKAQVIDFYVRVSEWLLPHLRDRPITLKRYPDGVGGPHFYEKNAPRFTPKWIRTFPVPRRAGGTDIQYVVIDDLPSLVWSANLANLEIHSFLHCVPHIDRPTEVVFDLDPGDGVDVIGCAEVALWVRDTLERLGLQSFPKVSGSKGMQISAPLNTPATYAETRPFAHGLAQALERAHPDRVISEMARTERKGKVFIDWSQNSDFKTTVLVYSMRAKREQPYISMPLTWEEVRKARNPDKLNFSPDAALRRLKRLGDLFAPVLTLKQKMPAKAPAAATR